MSQDPVNFGTWSHGRSIYLCIAMGKEQTAAGTPCPFSFDQEPNGQGRSDHASLQSQHPVGQRQADACIEVSLIFITSSNA